MAAHPILIVDEEIFRRLPEAFREDSRYQKGASLELVPLGSSAAAAAPEEINRRWEGLRGILAHSSYDPNAELEREKAAELAGEAESVRT